MDKLREESGTRRLRVQATRSPEARSRTCSRTQLQDASREPRSQRSRISFTTGHRNVLEDGSCISIHEAMRRARDKVFVETKNQVIRESRMMERTRSALMREIRVEAKELRLITEMKKVRHEKDSRIK